jgi:hypothetical protein
MASGFFLGLLVVVAQGANLVRVDVHEGQKLGTWALPSKALALFGAPDGGVFAPLAAKNWAVFLLTHVDLNIKAMPVTLG